MKQLLFSITAKDCAWQYFSVGGHGGAGKDTSNTGVRCVHEPSGAVGVGRDERSQRQNRQAAFRRMAESDVFQSWVRLRAVAVRAQMRIDEIVEDAMQEKNLRIEHKEKGGKWVLIESL